MAPVTPEHAPASHSHAVVGWAGRHPNDCSSCKMQLSGVDVAELESKLEMHAKLLIADVKYPFAARWRGCGEGGGVVVCVP